HANAMVGGTYNGYFKGGYEAAKKFMETKQPQKGIPDEQEAKFRIRGFEQNGPTFERYLNDPLTKTGAYLTIFNVHTEEVITLPPDQPSGWLKTKHEVEKAEPGEYKLRFRIGAVKGTPKERHFVALGSRMKPEEREDFTLMQTFQISGSTDAPQVIEVPVSITANGPRTFVLREKRDVKLDHELFTTAQKETGVGPPSALWIDWVEWEGPLAPPATIAKVTHIEPETKRAEVERGHLRYKYLNEQYAKWKAAGGDEKRLKEFDFTDKSHAEFAKVVWDQNNRWFQQYLDRPLSKTGLFLDNTVQETCEYAIDMPADLASGDYVMRVKIGRVPDMPSERAFLTFVEASPIDKDDRTFLANKQITATLDQPEIIELPFKIVPGGPRKFVLFEKRPLKKEAISLPGRTRLIADAKQRDPVLWIDWIEVESASPQTPVTASAAPPQKLRKDPEQWANKYMPIYAEGYAEKYSRFQKWCAAIDEVAKQPENVEAVAKLRADPRLKTQPHLFYSYFAKLKDSPPPSQFGFRDVDDAQFARSEYSYHHRYYADYVKLPQRETGAWLMLYSLGRYTGITAPANWLAGRYTLRVRIAASDESPKERRFIELGTGKADAADFNVLSSHQVTGTLASPQVMEIPVEINASGDRNFAIRDKRPNTREAEYAMFREAWDKTGTGPRPCIWVDFVELEGPASAVVPSAPALTKTIKERREVELHANAMVGGTYNGYFKGGYEAAKKFMETGQPQKGIPDEAEAKFRIRGFEQQGPTFERYLNDPLTKTGAYLTIYNVHKEEVITLPPDQP
ncbi:MAG: hypothetical protein EB082_15435, partial [Verrucomicrobia bacterium]|nr:hypothetical protein [Verrucomicrobiota bacterium]